MSSAGAHAVAVARPLPCWACRPSAWASIGLIGSIGSIWAIWAIWSCAPRRSWNGSHRVMMAIWSPSFMGPAARRLGEHADPKWVTSVHLPSDAVHSILNTVQLSRSSFREGHMDQRQRATPNTRATPASGEPATDGRSRSLWFGAPTDDRDRRPQLTRERVVAEALTVIAEDGVQALTMRTLAARLGVVPGTLYHHLRNKEQLHDLVLDNVLAEVDYGV